MSDEYDAYPSRSPQIMAGAFIVFLLLAPIIYALNA